MRTLGRNLHDRIFHLIHNLFLRVTVVIACLSVDFHLHDKPIDGQKEFSGILEAFDAGTVTIGQDGVSRTFERSDIATVLSFFKTLPSPGLLTSRI